MNILLLQQTDLETATTALVSGRQLKHMLEVHRASLGSQLRVGLINGDMGMAQIIDITPSHARLSIEWQGAPPPKLPLTLLLAMPRPKMLKRTLQTLTTMGVERLILLNTYRVEKSFWQTPILQDENLLEQCILGLEQARDTVLPIIELRKRFKPFVEDELPDIIKGTRALVAHPGTAIACPSAFNAPTTLAVGPEGGFIPYEVEKLQAAGFESIHMGPRILRVETAVPALISTLFTPS